MIEMVITSYSMNAMKVAGSGLPITYLLLVSTTRLRDKYVKVFMVYFFKKEEEDKYV